MAVLRAVSSVGATSTVSTQSLTASFSVLSVGSQVSVMPISSSSSPTTSSTTSSTVSSSKLPSPETDTGTSAYADLFAEFSKRVQSDPNYAKLPVAEQQLSLPKWTPVPPVSLHFLLDSCEPISEQPDSEQSDAPPTRLLNLRKIARPLFEASFDAHLLSPPELSAERRVYLLEMIPTRVLSETPNEHAKPLRWPAFDPGDAIAVIFENEPQEVDSLLERLGVPPELRDRRLHLQLSAASGARLHIPEQLSPFLEGANATADSLRM